MKKTMMVAAMAAALAMSVVPAAFASHTPVGDVVATGTLHITNNGSFVRDYDTVSYSCGTENEVLFSSSGDHRVPTTASEGETISGTINTSTFEMNWTYSRPDGYASSFVGQGIWSTDGDYSFLQDASMPSTGGVEDADGVFTLVPQCASVPSNPADTCKHGGWETHDEGPFKNQGQCVASHVRNNDGA